MVDFSGKKDALAIKKEYQEALDWAHDKVKNKIRFLYGMNHKLKGGMADIQKYKKDITADEEEREGAYEALATLLKKEEGHEGSLWKETTSMYKEVSKSNVGKTTKVKQKTKQGDQEIKFASMMKVLDKYPEYQTKSSFKRIREKIMDLEHNIKNTKKKYNDAVARTIKEISYFPRNIMEAEDIVKKFEDILKESNEKLSKLRYNKGFLFKISGESKKKETKIHSLYYEMESYKNTIKKLKEEVAFAKKQDLEEMDY